MIARIRALLEARPFVPFYVHTSGGNRYLVATPDHANINPSGHQVGIWFDDEGGIDIAGLHIVAVEKEAVQPSEAA